VTSQTQTTFPALRYSQELALLTELALIKKNIGDQNHQLGDYYAI